MVSRRPIGAAWRRRTGRAGALGGVAAEVDLTQRTLSGAPERLGRRRPAARIDAGLHTRAEVLLVQLHPDLLPARAGLGVIVARRQRAVYMVERRHHIEPVDQRDRGGE